MAVAIPSKVSKVVDIFVSMAAAVVIVGALFKLMHWKGADLMLIVGLGTEAVVFTVYGALYLYFPAVTDPSMDEVVVGEKGKKGADRGNPALKTMEKMLEEADITPANLSKLSAGFQKLTTSVDKIADVSDAVSATSDYTAKTKEAAAALNNVKDAYTNAASSMAIFNNASDSTKQFHEQVQVMTKNLSSLNTIYEMELQESNNHLKALNQFYGKLNQAASVMSSTAEDAQKAKEQIGALANNLGRLNNIYGNMLTAMQGGRS
ncbi:MAG TPA: gliding motility protein GldL [Chitinophagaceae bacterium]